MVYISLQILIFGSHTAEIKKSRGGPKPSQGVSKVDTNRELYLDGMITEAEYRKAVISERVQKVANKFDALLCISKPKFRDSISNDDVAKIFEYLHSELKKTEKAILKSKKPFTLGAEYEALHIADLIHMVE